MTKTFIEKVELLLAFKNKYLFVSLVFVCALTLFPKTSFAAIQIDSIKTTPSTCPNNGSITVYARNTTPGGDLFYSISGTVTEPTQTGNVFNSLPAGSYTIVVSDGGTGIATKDTTITGSYVPLDFSPITVSPYCVGNNNGNIIGNRTAGTGNGPFTWQLISPSLVTTIPQASDTFNNLPAGNYTVRLTDVCGSFRTIVATLPDPNIFYFAASIYMEEAGCDSSLIDIAIKAPPDGFRLPFTYKYVTKNGTYIPPAGSTTVDSIGGTQPQSTIYIMQLIPGITYGDSVVATIYDACGDSLSTIQQSYPYNFYFTYGYNNCGTSVTGSFNYIPPQGADLFGLKTPVTYTLVDKATNAIIADSTIITKPISYGNFFNNFVNYLPVSDSLPIGETYTLTVKDGCGKVFKQDYTVPSLAPPAIIGKEILYSPCIDSVMGVYRIHIQGFGDNPRIILLSGPSTLGSTKPGFTYTDTYNYPDTLGAGEYIFLSNLNVGTYQYKIIDDCGHQIFDSIVVTPSDIISLNWSTSYQKGCLGQNKIFYTLSHNNAIGYTPLGSGTVVVTNLSTGIVVKDQLSVDGGVYNDSVLNLPSGQYQVAFYFSEPGGYGTSINKTYTGCWAIKDTITIAGYQTPAITSSNSIICHNTIQTEVLPDSSKGVPPYQYEIINGPQTFPVQSSNLFPITLPGTYTASIFDVCGNGSTAQITVDTNAFPPINRIATNCNSIKLFYGSSKYYSYKWTKPNGTIYTGDTLIIDPVTSADTGIYFIRKITNVEGCTDTVYTSYHLSLIATYSQTIQFCSGIVVHVGTSTYNMPGIYTDTLRNANSLGCDSLVITSLIAMQKKDTNNVAICKGSGITVGTNVYTIPGLYKDSISNAAGCYDLIFTNVTFKQFKDTVNAVICAVDSIVVGSKVHKAAGTYIDTLVSSMGCDSIVTVKLTVNPNPAIKIIPGNTIVNRGDVIQLNVSPSFNYLWTDAKAIFSNDTIQNPFATINDSSWIYVTATDTAVNCSSVDSVFIALRQASTTLPCNGASSIRMPNAFDPDCHCINNKFTIIGTNIVLNEFQIFNRWGEMVYETKDITKGWDGTYNGGMLEGAYVYWISYFECNETKARILKGTVILIK
ncbi:MAG: gliding motility-associated C-terminal domain-containing protein [Ferruginibacter sp.]